MSLKKTNHSIPKAVWASIQAVAKETQELAKSQKENAKAQKETDRQLKESQKEIAKAQKENAKAQKETDRQLKETSKAQKETDRQLKESQKETAKAHKETERLLKDSKLETDRQFIKSDKRIAKLDELFTGQWGKLMEALVKGDLVKLLQERNIEVQSISRESSGIWNDEPFEFDIIVVNGSEVVVTEVKTTLWLKDLTHFINKLKNFKQMLPLYKDKIIYGAVAYLKFNQGSARKAEKEGLFVIRALGSSASIINAKHFKPKVFSNTNSKK